VIKVHFTRIDPLKVDRLRAWMDELNVRREEAHDTMANDTITHEASYILETSDGPILVTATFAQDPERAERMRFESQHVIAIKYSKVMHDVMLEILDPECVFEAHLE